MQLGETDEPLADPSWTTALSEAKAAARHLRQATAAVDRLERELVTLRESSETTARLDLAHALGDGPDGGALRALVTAADDEAADPGLRRTAGILLDRLARALGLEPVCERGEHLRLLPDELAEFEVRGEARFGRHAEDRAGAGRALCRVVRPGWRMGGHLVVRPLLEAVDDDPA